MRGLPAVALVSCVAVVAVAACATSPNFVGGSSDAAGSGGHGGLGTAASSSGHGGGSSSAASTGQGGASSAASTATASSSSGAGDGGVDCVAGAACTVDLSQCSASQEAPAWQGQMSLQGTLELDFYTSHKGWVCQVPAVGQGWPIIPEPGWWCGTATPRCDCSPADQCH